MTTLYGIPNCDTVKKACAWLEAHDCAFVFHDFRKLGVPPQQLAKWSQALGWWTLINRRGTTWRNLDSDSQFAVCDEASACALMLAQPSVIRRPVMDWDGEITVSFDEAGWNGRLGAARAAAPASVIFPLPLPFSPELSRPAYPPSN